MMRPLFDLRTQLHAPPPQSRSFGMCSLSPPIRSTVRGTPGGWKTWKTPARCGTPGEDTGGAGTHDETDTVTHVTLMNRNRARHCGLCGTCKGRSGIIRLTDAPRRLVHVEHGAMARRRKATNGPARAREPVGRHRRAAGTNTRQTTRNHTCTNDRYSGTVALKFYQFVFTINLFQFEWEYE